MAAAFVGLQFVQFPGIGIYGEQIPRLCDCPIFSPVDLGNNIEIIYLVDVRHILILIEICGTGFIKASGCFRYFTTFSTISLFLPSAMRINRKTDLPRGMGIGPLYTVEFCVGSEPSVV